MFFTYNDYYGSSIYKSSDYGNTFTQMSSYSSDEEDKIYVDISDNGEYILIGHDNISGYYNSGLRLSTDSGLTFTDVFLSGIQNDNNVLYLDVKSVSVSSTGQYMSVLTGDGGLGMEYKNQIYTSSDYGSTWTKHDIAKDWKEIKMSSGGQYQTAITTNNKIYVSSDFGVSFAERNLSKNWKCLTISSDGQLQVASSTTGTYFSYDAGLTWQELNTKSYNDISLSLTTLEAVGSTQPDGYTLQFENLTPTGYASQITNSHSDIIYDAPLKDNTAFELVSSRVPVELSSSTPLGYTVRLSPDGNTLGICDLNSSGSQRGIVKVYRWNGTTWNLIDTIQQDYHNDMQLTHFGGNIEFSNDGNIIAIAATGSGDRTGMVYVYTLDETDSNNVHYTQRGSTLHDIYETDVNSISYNNGTSNSQNKNRRIGFSSDAEYLAIGSPYYDDHTKGLVSNVTIYKWNTANSDWEVDQVLNASGLHKRFGFGLALSQDGQQLVIMEDDALRYYQKENGSFDEKWSIISEDNSDFSNMVDSLTTPNECKNLIRFSPDGTTFFVGFPMKKESLYFQT